MKPNFPLLLAALLPLLPGSASAVLVTFNTATDQDVRALYQSDGTTPYTTAAATGEVDIGATPIAANGADNTSIWADFGATITLVNTGDSITLNGLVTLSGAVTTSTTNQFRFGLFDTDGTSGATGWLGYYGSNDSTSSNSGVMQERNIGNASAYISTTGTSTLASYTTANATLTNDIQYSYAMTFTRNALGGLDYTATMFQATTPTNFLLNLSGTDATPQTFDFDRVGFLVGGSLDADRAQFRNVDVSVVPEPSCALLGGLGLLALLRRRR